MIGGCETNIRRQLASLRSNASRRLGLVKSRSKLRLLISETPNQSAKALSSSGLDRAARNSDDALDGGDLELEVSLIGSAAMDGVGSAGAGSSG